MAVHSMNLSTPLIFSSHSPSLPFSRLTHVCPPLQINRLSGKTTRLHSTPSKTSLTFAPHEKSVEKDSSCRHRDHGHGIGPLGEIATRWREIQGQNNWDGLLDPLDPLLKSELIRYGEFVQACYDAYDFDKFSMYCGSCKYNRKFFFESLGMSSCGYDVTNYLFATYNPNVAKFFLKCVSDEEAWSEKGNWIGYIAVSNDAETQRLGRRDIVVAWRGTVTNLEWIADINSLLCPVSKKGIKSSDTEVKVESGFLQLYTDKDPSCPYCMYSAREQVHG